jgi:peptidoglycan/xylan/chitin deacetylase (PgdA/CDA1 family)
VNRRIEIVMYHYVRDLARSRYPGIKGRTVEEFRGQIDWIRAHRTVISAEAVLDAIAGGAPLPPRACLLTFDDAFIDHFETVYPILRDLGLPGAFFPPARVVLEHTVLDVNKLHFVLASVDDPRILLDALFRHMAGLRDDYGLPTDEHYRATVDIAGNRWDTPDVAFFKRMLQRELPEPARVRITDRLFRDFVSADEAAFARGLYMSVDQMREMTSAGMYFGSHGYNHAWLNRLAPEEQEREIDLGLAFLRDLGASTDRWMMNYPYGGWNESLLHILRRKGCAAGLSTRVDVADLDRDDPLLLPRLNTNDLPVRADAPG